VSSKIAHAHSTGAACAEFLAQGLTGPIRVLDVGCGRGEFTSILAGRGCEIVGLDYDHASTRQSLSRGLRVCVGTADSLPFPDGHFDAVVSGVTLPYVDVRLAIAEMARVARPGAVLSWTTHGFGYGYNLLMKGPLNFRAYGVRMMISGLYYDLGNHRLKGKMGDTLCHRPALLLSVAHRAGLRLVEQKAIGTRLGLPRFLGQRFVKE
jgi:SAM-dependent methyltransferase